ncbi:MAG TPA: 3-isopropylmalate dehydratase small subunit [Thermomicrobiales bacterium]|jgi:3-isopropylmalate/(R)-2-methylmalate dehydratase small subunit|nr:3-isopropylmalate dehydratase small subunit [Thermomicrobiales bacterium]
MEPIRTITGTAVPLDRADVDTDQIIPAVWLKRVERTGFGAGLFSAWRENDPDFVLNRPEYQQATIMVAGPNFGVGSSREHAVWALQDYGFRAVISSRFGDIFRNNATKGGIIPVVVEQGFAEEIMSAIEVDPTTEVVIDLETRTVTVPALRLSASFPMDDFTRYRLMEGLDDIGLTLRSEDAISAYERRREPWKPTVNHPEPFVATAD